MKHGYAIAIIFIACTLGLFIVTPRTNSGSNIGLLDTVNIDGSFRLTNGKVGCLTHAACNQDEASKQVSGCTKTGAGAVCYGNNAVYYYAQTGAYVKTDELIPGQI